MKLLGRLALGPFVVLILLAGWIVLGGLAAKAGTADVAIVFGNTVERSGRPSARLRARLEVARDLYAARRVRRIIVTGSVGREGFDESLVMQRWLISAGVPSASHRQTSGRGAGSKPSTCPGAS